MQQKRYIGLAVKMLSNLIKREVGRMIMEAWDDEATVNHCHIIGYLYCNRNRDVFQRELETEFNIRRSTVTQTVQLMEKNGILERIPAENDARQKKLLLTAKGMEMQKKGMQCISDFESRLMEGISAEEEAQFFAVVEKLTGNLRKMAEEPTQK